MALKTIELFSTGVVAPEAYSMIALAQINKDNNRIEAEVRVYYNEDCAPKNNQATPVEPMNRFLYTIEDNATPQRDTTLWINKVGAGDITFTHHGAVLFTIDVDEENTLQDIADALLAETESFDIRVLDSYIVVQAIGSLAGSAGVGIDVQGDAIVVVNWVVGADAVPSDLETYFSVGVQSQEGINLQKQIYEHMKANDPRYYNAIDVLEE